MKSRPAVLLVLLLLLMAVMLAVRSPVLTVAQTAPSLSTDLPFYTLRDKQVVLKGTGYHASLKYSIWVQSPLDNYTKTSGLTFTATEKGEIASAVLPINSTSPLGTYMVSISNSTDRDDSVAKAHYGIWGTDKYVYQRTEIIQTRGGGILPKGGVTVTVRNPAGNQVYKTTVAANQTGAFLTMWKIPPDAMTESYTVFIDGTGTYDSPTAEFVSKSNFSVTPALLTAAVVAHPEQSYARTRIAIAQFALQYPDSKTVMSVKESIKPFAVYAGRFKIADVGIARPATASGVWTAQFSIPRNASLDAKYKFVLPANAFDDGNGNTGPGRDLETDSFSITAATLDVKTVSNSSHFRILFDTLTAYTTVRYPDGSVAINATLQAWVVSAAGRSNATARYDRAAGAWIIEYQFSMSDLPTIGSRTLFVEATDIYGNKGGTSLKVTADPYTFLEVVGVVVVALIVARWLLGRYWHRLYIRAKRISSALRNRRKSRPLGVYLSNSPVTP